MMSEKSKSHLYVERKNSSAPSSNESTASIKISKSFRKVQNGSKIKSKQYAREKTHFRSITFLIVVAFLIQLYFLCRVQDHTTIPQNDPLPGLKLRRGAYRPHPRIIDDKRHGKPSLHINGVKGKEQSTDDDENMDASHNTTVHKRNSRISVEHGRLKQPGVTAHRRGRIKEYIPPKKTSLLPKKIITVFGPESSGTTFIATTLGVALGIFPEKGRRFRVPSGHGGFKRIVEKKVNKRVTSDSGEWEVQVCNLFCKTLSLWNNYYLQEYLIGHDFFSSFSYEAFVTSLGMAL